MKKVLQTVVDPGNGNCMQAVVASLFELELNEVPNFIEMERDEWFLNMRKFYQKRGYPTLHCLGPKNLDIEFVKKILKHDGGVNGYFNASVPSQTFEDVTHAVVIDSDMNIVHDPNPNQKALGLPPESIEQIFTVKEDWYIDTDGSFVVEK